MGCGCCITSFRDEVEDEILSYIKLIKSHERNKKSLIFEIQKDLSKRAAVVDKYNYPYRKEDVKKTVNIYKNYIYKKFRGKVELLEDKIKYKEKEKEKEKKEEKENKMQKDDKKIIENNKTKALNTIEFEQNKKLNEIKKKEEKFEKNIDNENDKENKEKIVNSKNGKESNNIDNAIKSDLQPMLEDKIKNKSEQDESENQKQSFDNIKRKFLPKEENNQNKLEDKIIDVENHRLRYRESEDEIIQSDNEKSSEEKNKDIIERREIKII